MRFFSYDSKTKNVLVNIPAENDKDALLMIHAQPEFADLVIKSLELAKLKGKTTTELRFKQNGLVASSNNPDVGAAWVKWAYLDVEGAKERGCSVDISELRIKLKKSVGKELVENIDYMFAHNWIKENDASHVELVNMTVTTEVLIIHGYSGSAANNDFKEYESARIPLKTLGITLPEDLKPLTKTDLNLLSNYYLEKGGAFKDLGNFITHSDAEQFQKLLKGFESDFRNDLKLAKLVKR